MNSSMLGQGGGLTIPAHALEPIVEALLAGGKVKRAYLGISTQRVALPSAFATASQQESGLLVSGLEPGSPADAGGVLVGDILIGLGGATIERTEDLQEELNPELVGTEVQAKVLRGGAPVDLSITVGERN
jgi:S1-C subfamily serine protease